MTDGAGRIPLLIDCDTGIDDALALLYACGSPEADLVAVTCTGGNVEARQVVRNTLAVLELAGRMDVEVALGREAPIARPLVTTPETHGPQGIGDAVLAPPARPISARSGPALIAEEARRRPGELTLVTLAPLTNLAVALELEPRLPWLLRRVVIMGGAFGGNGNTNPSTEWNATVDPEAFAAVLAAWSPEHAPAGSPPATRPLVVGLDVTETHHLVPTDVEVLAAAAGGETPVVRFVRDALAFYIRFHEEWDGFTGAFIHDALAVAVALDPSLVRSEPHTVDVETAGRLTTGETVADRRHRWGRAPNADVATGVDAAAFHERLLGRIAAVAATQASARGGQA